MAYKPLGFSVHGIFQARMLQWAAISYPGRSSLPRDQTLISLVSPVLAGRSFTIAPSGKPFIQFIHINSW